MLWAGNVDIFVRLDLRGWAPPATHYHFNHCLWRRALHTVVQRRDGPRRLRNHDDDDDDDDDVYGSVGVRCPRFLWGQVSCIRGRHRATVFVVAEPSLSCPTRPGPAATDRSNHPDQPWPVWSPSTLRVTSQVRAVIRANVRHTFAPGRLLPGPNWKKRRTRRTYWIIIK